MIVEKNASLNDKWNFTFLILCSAQGSNPLLNLTSPLKEDLIIWRKALEKSFKLWKENVVPAKSRHPLGMDVP